MLAHESLRPWVLAFALSGFAHLALIQALPGRFPIAVGPVVVPVELIEPPAPPPVETPRPTPTPRPITPPEPVRRPITPPDPPRPRPERESRVETPIRETVVPPPPPVAAAPVTPDEPKPVAPPSPTPRADPLPPLAPAVGTAPTGPPPDRASAATGSADNRRAPSDAPSTPAARGGPSNPTVTAPDPAPPQTARTDPSPSRGTAPEGITKWAVPRGGYQVFPTYPASARRSGIQGTARLKVEVLADGRVGEIVVEASAGHPDLDRAATDAVKRWRFEPARRGADPVASWVLLPVEFRIDERR